MSNLSDRLHAMNAVERREAMDRRNAKRRADHRAGTGEYAGMKRSVGPSIRLWDDGACPVLDTEADDFLYRNAI